MLELTSGIPTVTLLLALLAGILTVAAPCTLPVLPVLLGASIGLSFPKIPSGMDSHRKAESSHPYP